MVLKHFIMVLANLRNNKFLCFIIKFTVKIIKYAVVWCIVSLVIFFIWFEIEDPFEYWYTEKSLGDDFEVTTKPYALIHKNSNRSGDLIIPYGIVAVKSDEKWVVAVSKNLNAVYKNDSTAVDGKQYWILDKEDSISYNNENKLKTEYGEYNVASMGLYGPYDSITFLNKIKDMGINLIPEKLH